MVSDRHVIKPYSLSFWVALLLSGMLFHDINAQTYLGFSAGFNAPGAQDQKFKNFGRGGELMEYVKGKEISYPVTSFNSVHFTKWFVNDKSKYKAVKVELVSWRFVSEAKSFTKEPPPFSHVTQARSGVFVSSIKKFNFKGHGNYTAPKDKAFGYWGSGLGLIHTDIDPGKAVIGGGFQIFSGVTIPIVHHLRLNLEAKYVLTMDVDNKPKTSNGWRVDTSGRPTPFRLHSHIDTRFLVLQVDLKWRISDL